MRLLRRQFLHLAAGAAALPAVARIARAQTYPGRTITIVVAAAPGGVNDVLARAIGQRLGEAWGVQVVIENKGGGGHIIGALSVAKAPPDGYTLLIVEQGALVINPSLYSKEKLSYDVAEDFAPITGLIRIHHALLATRSLPVRDVRELLDLAKQKQREITYGTAGFGSAQQMNFALIEYLAGVKFVPVYYRGATLALTDLIAGNIDMMLISVSSGLQPVEAGQAKMLAVGSPKRLPQLPDVPTMAEGGLPGYTAGTWFGMLTTAGTPHETVTKINAEVRRILADADFRDKFLVPQLCEPMASSPAEFAEFIGFETQKWAKVIREQKLTVDH